jgi:Holliday junction resolvase RusA-like endonuclease
MYEPKTFEIFIPIRAKAVQSTRFGRGFTYVDPKTRAWKNAVAEIIKPHIAEVPSPYPFEVVEAIYTFALPKTMTKKARTRIEDALEKGEDIAYISKPDLDSNINKGLCDLLTEVGLWSDDKHLWRVAEGAIIKKVYGKQDSIKLKLRETPFVLLASGKTAYEEINGTT